jgi:transcriptional regulator with XRE-family HTH domain
MIVAGMAAHPCTPLRRARQARGLTMKDVATAAGVTARTVLNAEHGRHEPHPSSKTVLAQALGMEASDLWPRREREAA